MKEFHVRKNKRWLALSLCLLMLPFGTAANKADLPPSDIEKAAARPQIVRVQLSRLGITNRMDIVLDGIYSLGNKGQASMIFERGSQLTFMLAGGSLKVYYQGMSFNAGAGVYLTRYQADDGAENGIRLVGQEALYEGDLELNADGEVIRPILHIHVEDYLHGVVPYEMSNEFPLEALKAQAVTARTYALRKQDSAKPYDLVDTTNDQVFKGRVKGYERADQAVEETRGVCGFYKNELAQCFYGASNGGQTELVEHVWTGGGDYGYYQTADDAYDLENPLSLVKTFTVKKKPGKNEAVGFGLRKLLADALKDELVKKGYDPAPESLRVDEVQALSVDTPAFPDPSRLMSKFHITFLYSGRTRTDAVVPAAGQGAADADQEEIFLFETPTPSPAPTPTPKDGGILSDITPSPEPTPAPTPEPVYGEFQAVKEPVTLDLDVFPAVEQNLALGLNDGYDNEMLTVVEKANSFTVEARRYGHGVGMSQRGAEWMAARYGKTYLDILHFYYPGMALKQFPDQDAELPLLDSQELATPGPPPTPTPRPTLMPVTGETPKGAWVATVTGIDDDSTLNLRAAPDMSGEVLMRLYKHQPLLVLERCQEAGWVKVKTDVVEGYVMEKFLKAE